ncbi:MAG: phospholipase D-like domain-containing protein [Actinomycetota bacterium]
MVVSREGEQLHLGGNNPLHRLDRTIGDGLEQILRVHHRRRLSKIGWGAVFDPGPGRWAMNDPPPRRGNELRICIDGRESFDAIIEGVRNARTFVHLAGWHMEHDFILSKDPVITLEDLIAEAGRAVAVRVLVWGGAPLPPPFRPRRGEAHKLGKELARHDGVHFAIDSKERLLHCHHEKLVIIDGDLAFVGGLDFSTLGANRLDTNDHPPREPMGWHDAVARIKGPLVADVAQHFNLRWSEVTGEALEENPIPEPVGEVEAQLVRTVPEKIYDALPRGDFRLLASYVGALREAEKFIYLENQFLWSSEIVKILADKLKHPPSDDFRIVVLLPSKPSTGKDDTLGQLAVLAEADDNGENFLACTLYGRDGDRTCPVYVHAKIGIVDTNGSRSVPATSTTTRCSTIQRSMSLSATPDSRALRACVCGRSTSRCQESASRPIPPRSSMNCGNRSRSSSSNSKKPAWRSRAEWYACSTCPSARRGCSAPSRPFSSTVDQRAAVTRA